MKFGIHLGSLNPKAWVDVVKEADRVGFDTVWMPEHLVVPYAATGSPHAGSDHPPIPPEVPIFDVFVYLGHIAAVTERIRLGTDVYNIGLRHPFVTARAATTLDIVSNGRLDLGIGASWLREEWDAVNLDFDTRGKRVDEAIEICRRLWSDEKIIEHHGEFFDFGPVAPDVERRAGTVGTGWIPMNHALEDLPASLAKLNELSERHGRSTPIELTTHGDVEKPGDIERYADVGITQLIVRPWSRTSDALDGVRRFADNVIAPHPEDER